MIKYLSDLGDLYNTDEDPSNNVDRISNPLQYRWVKAYPSVNSTNGGGINSEENLRWLTKQFTQKSFLIPRPNSNTSNEFSYTGTVLNAGQATGGMANIDGYIFNIANDINMMSYDSEGESWIGTDESGYIAHQNLQYVKKNFIHTDANNYISSEINEYLFDGTDSTPNYLMDDTLNPDWKNTWNSLRSLAEAVPQNVGRVQLYYDKIISSQVNWVDIETGADKSVYEYHRESDGSTSITYNIYYGNCDYPKLKCEYPVIYFKDVFGFSYIFDSYLTVTTSSYPGTQYECIDMLHDTYTPGDSSEQMNRKTVTGIYDMTSIYTVIEEGGAPKDFHYKGTSETANFYNRDSSQTPTYISITDTSGILGDAFTIVHDYDLIAIYNDESPNSELIPFLQSDICNYYYCLPISKLVTGYSNILQQRPQGSTRYIPITFMGADGILYPINIENENSEDGLPVAEGYVSFFRRICKQLVIDEDNTDNTSPLSPLYYEDDNNKLDINKHTDAWNRLFKYLEKHGANNTTYVSNNWATLSSIFNVSIRTDLTLSVVYNTIIAPYINFYTQLSWSSLYTNIIDVAQNASGSFKSFCAGSVLDYSASGISRYSNNYAEVIANYSIVTDNTTMPPTTITTTKTALYPIREYTDTERLRLFAYNINPDVVDANTPKILAHRDRLETLEHHLNIDDCEDLINYIKKCTVSKASMNKTGTNNRNILAIPYKVTTLNMTSGVYGFNIFNGMIDRCAEYKAYTFNNGADVEVSCYASSGYIQNVKIDMSTLIPDREFYVLRSTETGINGYNFIDDNNHLTASMDFSIRLGKNIRWDYNLNVLNGTDGFNFVAYSQGWSSYVPTVFELFKNSQNHLLGKDKTTSEHAGIDIDFKFPTELDETDLWFTNQWLSNIKTVTAWEIETSGTNYPTNTDGMIPYLETRNTAKFPLDAIYTTVDGDIIAIPEWINMQLNDNLMLIYADRVDVGNSTYMYQSVAYNGLPDNVRRLKEYVDDTNWTVSYMNGSSQTRVRYKNHNYKTIDGLVSELIIKGTNYSDLDFNNGLNTVTNSAHVLDTTLKVSFHEKCEVLLDTILNPMTYDAQSGKSSNNYMPIMWTSNYPIETVENYKDYSDETNLRTAYKLTLRDFYNMEYTTALFEIRIVPSEDKTFAYGYCKISLVANPNTLTSMDASYLVKELYHLDTVTWNQVSEATQAGFAPKLWEVGDTKTFTITNGEGDEYTVSAMIIGFNQDGENTITWMTNLYNNGADSIPETDTILYKKFEADFDTFDDGGTIIANNQDGYDTTDVYRWLNIDMVNNGYIEEDLMNIIKPVNKNSAILYLLNDNVHGYKHKTAYYKHDNTQLTRLSKFWLPSIYEIGIDPTLVDSIENTAITFAKTHYQDYTDPVNGKYSVNTANYNIGEVNSLRGNCNRGDSNFLDAPSMCYEYFKKDTDEQNVKSVTMLSRSFYAVYDDSQSSNDRFIPPNTPESAYPTFSTFPRAMYCVGTGYDSNTTSGRWLTVLDREDVIEYLDNQVTTDFCFVTK